jgi:hypothetical protein
MTPSAHDSINRLINERLSRRLSDKLNKETCMQIYGDIFYALSEVFEKVGTPLDNEAVNLLSQMYYDSVTVNGNQELDPDIFTQRAKFENIPTKQLALMCTMYTNTPFAPIFISQIRKRN